MASGIVHYRGQPFAPSSNDPEYKNFLVEIGLYSKVTDIIPRNISQNKHALCAAIRYLTLCDFFYHLFRYKYDDVYSYFSSIREYNMFQRKFKKDLKCHRPVITIKDAFRRREFTHRNIQLECDDALQNLRSLVETAGFIVDVYHDLYEIVSRGVFIHGVFFWIGHSFPGDFGVIGECYWERTGDEIEFCVPGENSHKHPVPFFNNTCDGAKQQVLWRRLPYGFRNYCVYEFRINDSKYEELLNTYVASEYVVRDLSLSWYDSMYLACLGYNTQHQCLVYLPAARRLRVEANVSSLSFFNFRKLMDKPLNIPASDAKTLRAFGKYDIIHYNTVLWAFYGSLSGRGHERAYLSALASLYSDNFDNAKFAVPVSNKVFSFFAMLMVAGFRSLSFLMVFVAFFYIFMNWGYDVSTKTHVHGTTSIVYVDNFMKGLRNFDSYPSYWDLLPVIGSPIVEEVLKEYFPKFVYIQTGIELIMTLLGQPRAFYLHIPLSYVPFKLRILFHMAWNVGMYLTNRGHLASLPFYVIFMIIGYYVYWYFSKCGCDDYTLDWLYESYYQPWDKRCFSSHSDSGTFKICEKHQWVPRQDAWTDVGEQDKRFKVTVSRPHEGNVDNRNYRIFYPTNVPHYAVKRDLSSVLIMLRTRITRKVLVPRPNTWSILIPPRVALPDHFYCGLEGKILNYVLSSKKKGLYLRALELLRTAPFNHSYHHVLKTKIKDDETLVKREMKPRSIINVPPICTIVLRPFIEDVEHALEQIYPIQIQGHVSLTYAGRVTDADLSVWLMQRMEGDGVSVLCKGDDCIVLDHRFDSPKRHNTLCGDFSKFDRSVNNDGGLDSVFNFFLRFMRINNFPEWIICMVTDLGLAKIVAYCGGGSKVEVEHPTVWFLGSGTAFTTLVGTLINISLWCYIVHHCEWEDDQVVMDTMEDFGFSYTMRRRDIWEADFLKLMPIPYSGGVYWAQLPSRIIKFGRIWDNRDVNKHIQSVLGGYAYYGNSLLIRALIKRFYVKANKVVYDDYKIIASGQFSGIDGDYSGMCRRYGFTLTDFLKLEELIMESNLGQMISSPIFQRLAEEDY